MNIAAHYNYEYHLPLERHLYINDLISSIKKSLRIKELKFQKVVDQYGRLRALLFIKALKKSATKCDRKPTVNKISEETLTSIGVYKITYYL